jgi:hypothetical protein
MKVDISDIEPCSSYMNQHFEATYDLHLLPVHLLALWFLARLIFDHKDGGNMLPRNFGSCILVSVILVSGLT